MKMLVNQKKSSIECGFNLFINLWRQFDFQSVTEYNCGAYLNENLFSKEKGVF